MRTARETGKDISRRDRLWCQSGRWLSVLAGAGLAGCIQASPAPASAAPANSALFNADIAGLSDIQAASDVWDLDSYHTAIPWDQSWDSDSLNMDIAASNTDDLSDLASALDFGLTVIAETPSDADQREDARSELLAPEIIVARVLNTNAILSQADPTDDWTPAPSVMASLNTTSLNITSLDGTAGGVSNVMSDEAFGHPLVTTDSEVVEPASFTLMASGLLGLVMLRRRQS